MTFSRRIALLGACTLAAAGLLPAAAVAQPDANWPSKPIKWVVPFPPGGAMDVIARTLGEKAGRTLGQPFVIENRPGAGGNIGADAVAKSPADGYTIMITSIGMATNKALYPRLSYDPVKDFAPISLLAIVPNVLVVNTAKTTDKSVADVIAHAKRDPGKLTYASAGNGTSIHLAGDLFEKAAGIKLSHVPYKGSNPALMDALAGNVELLVSSLPSAMGQIKAGKLRPLAVTSAKRSSSLPDVPTVAESGFKGFDVSTWYGVLAPAGTPPAVVNTLNAEVNKLLATADMKAAIQAQGAEPQAMSPEQFSTLLKNEYVQWKGIVEASGARIE